MTRPRQVYDSGDVKGTEANYCLITSMNVEMENHLEKTTTNQIGRSSDETYIRISATLIR